MGSRKLKVVVDGGNGVGGMVGPDVLRGLGVEVIELYCDPDGRFPNHHPDPTVLKNIVDLVAAVKAHGADFGIGWDGDADRIGVVDEKGEPVFGDMLLLIYGRAILAEKPGATIIGDVKCSSQLFDDLSSRGANAIMWKTGHSLIKGKLKETHGDLAGEMSGHIFFKHRYYGFDDALYASCRLVEIASKHAGPISSLLSGLAPMVSTPEIRVDCPEEIKFRIAQEAQSAFADFKVDTIDGVRVTFPKGWGLVRASNTQPVLVMRFEAETPELLESYKKTVLGRIEDIKSRLA
jgi:phosphomannomutase/phosphoglucomutase